MSGLHFRGRPRCRPPVELCHFCARDPWGEVLGCIDFPIRGRSRLPHEWPADLGIPDDNPCQCGARVGHLHHYGCDIEVCPWSEEHPDEGERLLGCGCIRDSGEHGPGQHPEGEP